MSKLHFLRRPVRLLLYALLLALTTSAALIFSLQAHIDGLAIDQALDAYSFIGTLRPSDPSVSTISQEAVDLLRQSELVAQTQTRQTCSARIQEETRIPDYMMTTQQIHQHYFIEATVTMQLGFYSDEFSTYERYYIRVDRQWGWENTSWPDMTVSLTRGPNKEDYLLAPGEKFFFVGEYQISYYAGAIDTTTTTAYTPDGLEALGMLGQSALLDSGVLLIPDGLSREETEELILEHMADTGILGLYQTYCDAADLVSVHTIQDFDMLPLTAENYIYISEGRGLTQEDLGKKVCLVSQNFSIRNRLAVGRTIQLALGDGCYVLNGYESGYPSEYDTDPVEYGEFEEYEIVGFYHQLGRDADDFFFMDHNDILIPGQTSTTEPLSYNFTFRVQGPDHEAFQAQVQPELARLGYQVKFSDSDWYEVENSFQAMLERRELMLTCSGICYGVAVLLLVLLLLGHFRYDYGLSRLLGAYRREAVREYLLAFLMTALPGCAAAMGGAWLVYDRWLRETMTVEGVPGLLLKWSACEMAAALALLVLLVFRADRKRLLKLVR